MVGYCMHGVPASTFQLLRICSNRDALDKRGQIHKLERSPVNALNPCVMHHSMSLDRKVCRQGVSIDRMDILHERRDSMYQSEEETLLVFGKIILWMFV